MELNHSKANGYLILEVNGRLDTTNYGEFEKSLVGFIDGGETSIIINLAGLTYVSSSGLRVLLMGLKKITGLGGKFHLCCLPPNIHEIFEIAGFCSIFTIFPSLEEAQK